MLGMVGTGGRSDERKQQPMNELTVKQREQWHSHSPIAIVTDGPERIETLSDGSRWLLQRLSTEGGSAGRGYTVNRFQLMRRLPDAEPQRTKSGRKVARPTREADEKEYQ